MQRNAHAKVNWSLAVLGTRADGYHLLDMLMQTITLHDTLHFVPADAISLTIEGADALSAGEDNLVLRAARLLRSSCNVAQGATIRLKKRIPFGAGLGGGSADAAATLLALNDLWETRLSAEELAALGLQLGADVPYCLIGGLAHVSGIGETVRALGPVAPQWLVLTKPDAGLSTPAVYRQWDQMRLLPQNPDIDAAETALISGDTRALAAHMGNALQAPAIALLPVVRDHLDTLVSHGALKALMTGSGSAVFGLFENEQHARTAARELNALWFGTTC